MNLFDTNVLIAAMLSHREHHEVAKRVFVQHRTAKTAAISSHSLAEVYNVLTGRVRIPPTQAMQLMQLNLRGVEVVALESTDYENALRRVSSLGLSGGVVFDALVAECTLKIGAEALLTFNTQHFLRLGPDVAKLVREPV
jgi:predicted nucleic acid-binding protein